MLRVPGRLIKLVGRKDCFVHTQCSLILVTDLYKALESTHSCLMLPPQLVVIKIYSDLEESLRDRVLPVQFTQHV